MNLPDVTLFFQMVHFIIAYAILRRFVFAPTLRIIEAGENRIEQLQKKVELASKDHQGLLQQQRQKWRFIQQSLRDMVPKINEKLCINSAKVSTPVRLDNATISGEQKKAIKNMLYDELLDVGR